MYRPPIFYPGTHLYLHRPRESGPRIFQIRVLARTPAIKIWRIGTGTGVRSRME